MSECKACNAIVGQSGGPPAAINATLAGVIEAVLAGDEIETLYGAFNGIEGILSDRFCDLTDLFRSKAGDLDLLSKTPAAALGSCRVKLPDPHTESGDTYQRIFSFFKKYNVRYFFYIGGNDSMDTVMKLSAASARYAPEMRFIGIPKTIDNDLCGTDNTPGFGSAAKYIASTMTEIVRDCAVYTVKSVTLVEIMGRDAGWLTAAASLPSLVNGEGPDLAYFPEIPFDKERFFDDIENVMNDHPNVVIAVSEGLRYADGRYVGEGTQSSALDIFGHKYLAGTAKALEFEVKNRFGCKVRSFDLCLPQRCAGHLMSETDRMMSIRTGNEAVEFALKGESACLICCERHIDPQGCLYFSYLPKDVREIANKVRTMPAEFINESKNGITEECAAYLLPLISGETETKYENGLPKHYIINRN